jgi:hypothetical protein
LDTALSSTASALADLRGTVTADALAKALGDALVEVQAAHRNLVTAFHEAGKFLTSTGSTLETRDQQLADSIGI